ncbi:MAG: acyl-CoA thioesterase [Planctomycetota bacterium]|jgi:acyl-CoA thioester hydrolase
MPTPTELAADLAPHRGSVDLAAPGLDGAVAHPRPFACSLVVHPGQMSRAVEHVSNVQFVAWLDRAAELHTDDLGFTRESMLADGIMWFVARHEIDYRAEAGPGDELLLLTWVRDLRRVKSWRDTVIVRPADGQTVCRASTLWVLVDLDTRRPRRVPSEMIERLDPLEPPVP